MTYVPSPTERRTFRSVLRRRTPTAAVYRQYRIKADFYLARAQVLPPSIRMGGRLRVATRVEMRHSALFKREYLVAHVDGAWLCQVAPNRDAIAASMVQASTPPLVVVPTADTRTDAFTSIIEHEFVHISQVLLGLFPLDEMPATAAGLLQTFFVSTQLEYEAHVLQHTRWPEHYTDSPNLPLDRYCVLCGYSTALEQAIVAIGKRQIPRQEAIRFIRSLPDALVDGFGRVGIDQGHSTWFREQWRHHLAIALQVAAEEQPNLRGTEAFEAIAGW